MKTTKLFFIAALALLTSACSNIENDFSQQSKTAAGITITTKLAPKAGEAATSAAARAVSEGSESIVSEWAEDEHIAVLYEVDGTKKAADATITAVDGNGTATIEFTVEDGTPNNTDCLLVYPLSAAKDDNSGVKDAATLLAAQDGTLNASLDVRVGEGTIQTTTPGLTVTTQPAAQFAIFKFTVLNSDASAFINVKPLTITMGGQKYVITPATATSELFAALPDDSDGRITFTATDSDSNIYTCSKTGVIFVGGKYYESTLKMTPAVTYSVSVADGIQNGTVSTDLASAMEGDVVTITVTPDTGYELASLTVTGVTSDMNVLVSDNTFTMPDDDVCINATFQAAQVPAGTTDSYELFYTLDGTVTKGSTSYSTENMFEQGNVTWMVMGNIGMNPWRIGGNSISGVDRPVYSTDPLNETITKVELDFGYADSITVNSITMYVASDAEFTTIIDTKNVTFSVIGEADVTPTAGKEWTNAYYKFVFNVSVNGSSNRYLQLYAIKFYTAPQAGCS